MNPSQRWLLRLMLCAGVPPSSAVTDVLNQDDIDASIETRQNLSETVNRQVNVAKFLFGEEDDKQARNKFYDQYKETDQSICILHI